jgi:hypothetical protein
MLLPLVCLTGCTDYTSEMNRLRDENAELRSSVDHLQTQMKVVTQQVFDLVADTGEAPAYVVLGSGYGFAKTHLGTTFLVSWEDSKPQGDGTLVVLDVGVPYSAAFGGVKLSVTHHKSDDSSATIPNVHFPVAGQIDHRLTDRLLGGRWNRVSFRIPGVKPEDIGQLRISITPDVVFLAK